MSCLRVAGWWHAMHSLVIDASRTAPALFEEAKVPSFSTRPRDPLYVWHGQPALRQFMA